MGGRGDKEGIKMAKKKTITGEIQIPQPQKSTASPDLDFCPDLQTDFFTLDPLEKVTFSKIKSLKDSPTIETEKIKK